MNPLTKEEIEELDGLDSLIHTPVLMGEPHPFFTLPKRKYNRFLKLSDSKIVKPSKVSKPKKEPEPYKSKRKQRQEQMSKMMEADNQRRKENRKKKVKEEKTINLKKIADKTWGN